MTPAVQMHRLLDVVEAHIVPLTRDGVAAGNKVFGAAVLDQSLEVIVAGTNAETASPLWHGEMSALHRFFNLEDRPDPQNCILLSTHEPCSMCISAIAWCGIPTVYYLFDYRDTRDMFAIPYDLEILREIFNCTETTKSNRFLNATCIATIIEEAEETERAALQARLVSLREIYRNLSEVYQQKKKSVFIPLK